MPDALSNAAMTRSYKSDTYKIESIVTAVRSFGLTIYTRHY
jgi:hypothetical protein